MSVEAIMQLQAFAGNAAVAELLERQSRPPMASPSPPSPSAPAGDGSSEAPHEASSPVAGNAPPPLAEGRLGPPGGASLIENAVASAVPFASAIGGPAVGQ